MSRRTTKGGMTIAATKEKASEIESGGAEKL
jgi:hypothetical protein